jgi:mycofactocin precursor
MEPQHHEDAVETTTEGVTADSLIEEVSIDGMCGVY